MNIKVISHKDELNKNMYPHNLLFSRLNDYIRKCDLKIDGKYHTDYYKQFLGICSSPKSNIRQLLLELLYYISNNTICNHIQVASYLRDNGHVDAKLHHYILDEVNILQGF